MNSSILVVSVLNRRPRIDELFQRLEGKNLFIFEKLDVKSLKSFSVIQALINESLCSLVVLDLPHSFLRKYPFELSKQKQRIFIYEEDACQNYMPDSRWYGDFLRFYKKIPNVCVIATGFNVSRRLEQSGVKVVYLSKGYDSSLLLSAKARVRDISLGFVGTLGSNTYFERQKMLRYMEENAGLSLIRTSPGKEYYEILSRIRVFFSADCGIGEYMAKNFEAMASGCLLLAYRQGFNEEEAIGIVDGVNAVLYDSYSQALEKYHWIENNPKAAEDIAESGRKLVLSQYSLKSLSKKLAIYIDGDS